MTQVPKMKLPLTKYLSKCSLPGAGALVQWLWEKTDVQEAVSSNPSTRDWMDIFHIKLFV